MSETALTDDDAPRPLRYGWTTGACATAAAKAAYQALLTGRFPDPVTIRLPKGQTPSFALARERLQADVAEAGVIKDAGDDPDVTHGALVLARVRHGAPGSGPTFRAGEGVGMVTKPGLPLALGEPAINPVPRAMMRDAIREVAETCGGSGDVVVEIAIPGGEALALKTWNPRLGILGGLSILGTTGIVVPYSCSAWIHAIHRGIDVARALGHAHVAGSVGATSERLVQSLYGLPETALIDMGDFVGGMLKYLRTHPVGRVTIAGGFAKISKLAQGHLDLHSGRSQVDPDFLATLVRDLGGDPGLVGDVRAANTALQALHLAEAAGCPVANRVAALARDVARGVLASTETRVDVVVSDRDGRLVGRAE